MKSGIFIWLNSLYLGLGYLLFRLSYFYLSHGSDRFLCGWVDPKPCDFSVFLKEGSDAQIFYIQAFVIFLFARVFMMIIAQAYDFVSPYVSKKIGNKISAYKGTRIFKK